MCSTVAKKWIYPCVFWLWKLVLADTGFKVWVGNWQMHVIFITLILFTMIIHLHSNTCDFHFCMYSVLVVLVIGGMRGVGQWPPPSVRLWVKIKYLQQFIYLSRGFSSLYSHMVFICFTCEPGCSLPTHAGVECCGNKRNTLSLFWDRAFLCWLCPSHSHFLAFFHCDR